MIGKTKRREQGLADPLLVQVMKDLGIDKVPLYEAQSDARREFNGRIKALTPRRHGPVGSRRRAVADAQATAAS